MLKLRGLTKTFSFLLFPFPARRGRKLPHPANFSYSWWLSKGAPLQDLYAKCLSMVIDNNQSHSIVWYLCVITNSLMTYLIWWSSSAQPQFKAQAFRLDERYQYQSQGYDTLTSFASLRFLSLWAKNGQISVKIDSDMMNSAPEAENSKSEPIDFSNTISFKAKTMILCHRSIRYIFHHSEPRMIKIEQELTQIWWIQW